MRASDIVDVRRWSRHEVIGIDPSTKLNGVLQLSSNGASARGWSFSLGNDSYSPAKSCRAFAQLDEILGMLPANHVPVVFIESPIVGRGGVNTTVVQAYINSAYQIVTQRHGFPCRLVNNSAWKKRVVGNGSAKKEHVIASVRRDWLITYPGLATVPGISDGTASEDLFDAAGVAIYGLRRLQRRVRLAYPGGLQGRR